MSSPVPGDAKPPNNHLGEILLGIGLPAIVALGFFLAEQPQEKQERDEASQRAMKQLFRDLQKSEPAGKAGQPGQIPAASKDPVPPTRTTPWDPAELIGYTFALDAEFNLQTLSFTGAAEVVVHVGVKGRPAARLPCRWALDGSGTLNISDPESGVVVLRLLKIDSTDDQFDVLRGGKREAYTRTKN